MKTEIYFVFVIVFLLALWSEKTNKKAGMFLAILLLSAFVGFRDVSIGNDTQTYYDFLVLLEEGIYSPNVEKGFLIFSNIMFKIFGNIPMVFFVYSLITNACVLIRLWTLRRVAPFSQMCLLYLILFYPGTCNILRQSMVVAVVFLATILLEQKKYVPYVVVVSACFFIHKTSILAFLLLPLFIFFSDTVKRRTKRIFLLVGIILMPIVMIAFLAVFSKYSYYFSNRNNSFGLMNPAKLTAWCLCSFIFCDDVFVKRKKRSNEYAMLKNSKFIMVCYLIGILIAFLGYFKTTLTRVGMCFSIFEIVYIPMVCCRSKKGKLLAKLMYFVIIGYAVFASASSGWSQLGNYVSVFSNN